MADEIEMPQVGEEIAQRVEEIKRSAGGSSSGNGTVGKRAVIALFIAVGAFFAYVLWRQHQMSTATTTATGEIQQDETAAGTQANLDTQLAAISQNVASESASLSAQLAGVNSNVSGARTDASVALNILKDQAAKKPAPVNVSKKPAPAPLPVRRQPIATHPVADKYHHVISL